MRRFCLKRTVLLSKTYGGFNEKLRCFLITSADALFIRLAEFSKETKESERKHSCLSYKTHVCFEQKTREFSSEDTCLFWCLCKCLIHHTYQRLKIGLHGHKKILNMYSGFSLSMTILKRQISILIAVQNSNFQYLESNIY